MSSLFCYYLYTSNTKRCNNHFQPFTPPSLLPLYTWHAACHEPAPLDAKPVPSLSTNAAWDAKPLPSVSTNAKETNRIRNRWASTFSKRRMTLLDKANSLNKDCGVDVYLCVRNRRNNQIWSYSSDDFVPPTEAEIVRPPQASRTTLC